MSLPVPFFAVAEEEPSQSYIDEDEGDVINSLFLDGGDSSDSILNIHTQKAAEEVSAIDERSSSLQHEIVEDTAPMNPLSSHSVQQHLEITGVTVKEDVASPPAAFLSQLPSVTAAVQEERRGVVVNEREDDVMEEKGDVMEEKDDVMEEKHDGSEEKGNVMEEEKHNAIEEENRNVMEEEKQDATKEKQEKEDMKKMTIEQTHATSTTITEQEEHPLQEKEPKPTPSEKKPSRKENKKTLPSMLHKEKTDELLNETQPSRIGLQERLQSRKNEKRSAIDARLSKLGIFGSVTTSDVWSMRWKS